MNEEDEKILKGIQESLAAESPGYAQALSLEELMEKKKAALAWFARDAYDLWLQELSLEIKRDESTKSITLLTCLSAYGDDPQNEMLKGESSIGKTWNAMNVVRYFPPEDVWLLGGLSPTALVHDHGQLEHAETGEPLDEDYVDNKMDEWDEKNPEPDKGKVAHKKKRTAYLRQVKKEWKAIPKKYVVDLSRKILLFLEAPHVDTFNRLRPILSHDAYEITYKFTDRGAKQGLATQTVTLRGWPATIFCTTDKTWMEDLATRSFTATPSTAVEKLKAAIILTGEKESTPWLFEGGVNELFTGYILELKNELLAGWRPIIPFAKLLADRTPPSLGRDMRDFKHLLTLVKMMALLHFYVRPKVEIAGRKYVLATMKDFAKILEIWSDVEATTRSGLSGEEMEMYNCLVELEKHMGFIRSSDIVDEYNRRQAKKIASPTAYKYLDNLCKVGYVDKRKDDRTKEEGGDARYNLYWTLKTPKNAISRAWEYFPAFFTEESLEKWFVELKNYYPKNELLLTVFFNENGPQTHVLDLDAEGKIIKKHVLKNLFLGEYFFQPTNPEKTPFSEEKPQKYSQTENIGIQGSDGLRVSPEANCGVQPHDEQEEKRELPGLTLALGTLYSKFRGVPAGVASVDYLASLMGWPSEFTLRVLLILKRDKLVFKTPDGLWRLVK